MGGGTWEVARGSCIVESCLLVNLTALGILNTSQHKSAAEAELQTAGRRLQSEVTG